jgi:hypothetical protein
MRGYSSIIHQWFLSPSVVKALLKDCHIAFSGLVKNQCCVCGSHLLQSFQHDPFFNVFNCFWSDMSQVRSPSFFFEIAWLFLQLDGVALWRNSGIRFLHFPKKWNWALFYQKVHLFKTSWEPPEFASFPGRCWQLLKLCQTLKGEVYIFLAINRWLCQIIGRFSPVVW